VAKAAAPNRDWGRKCDSLAYPPVGASRTDDDFSCYLLVAVKIAHHLKGILHNILTVWGENPA